MGSSDSEPAGGVAQKTITAAVAALMSVGVSELNAKRLKATLAGGDLQSEAILLHCGFDQREAQRLAMTYTRGRIIRVLQGMVRKLAHRPKSITSLPALMHSWLTNKSKPTDLMPDGQRLEALRTKRLRIGSAA